MSRNTLRAFALGVITATTLLSLIYFFDTKHISTNTEIALTEDNVNEYLADNDLVKLSKEEYREFRQSKEQLKQQKEEKATGGKEQNSNNDKKQEPQTPDVITYSYIIREGTTSMEVATALEANKIIEDATDFNNYLIDNNLETSIQIGTYQFTNNMNYKTISKIITK